MVSLNVVDAVSHGGRACWLPGAWLAVQLGERQADAALSADLDCLVGGTADELFMADASPRVAVERV